MHNFEWSDWPLNTLKPIRELEISVAFFKWPDPGHFLFIFVLLSLQFQLYKLKKYRWYAGRSNGGRPGFASFCSRNILNKIGSRSEAFPSLATDQGSLLLNFNSSNFQSFWSWSCHRSAASQSSAWHYPSRGLSFTCTSLGAFHFQTLITLRERECLQPMSYPVLRAPSRSTTNRKTLKKFASKWGGLGASFRIKKSMQEEVKIWNNLLKWAVVVVV